MLPKLIYEPYPFILFALSLICFILRIESMYFWASLLMIISSYFIIQRSNYRRQDATEEDTTEYKIPATLYEVLPYAYIAFGSLAYASSTNELAFIGLFLIICGMGLCLLREANRHAFIGRHN
ncbi:hypothetical protein [Catenovulum sediminis]|uniref:hypothetical protein n=1 Tax=Catenovulum sediminis TaxID=1740262 RepID=UPI00117EBF96|nr:hypothetical protein [Catenovulum sediminis]